MYTVTLVVFPEIALVLELLVYGSIAGVGDFCSFFGGLRLILLFGIVSGIGRRKERVGRQPHSLDR